ncbi:MAG TPA: hypothetical protein PKZ75_09220 [Bacteroidia bacterium]|nr:hypothetical protein [Bacteroidia bacterium]
MEKYNETLHDLTWPELLQQVSAILARDAKTLESNVNYYMKLFSDSNSDKNQLNKLFEKLQLDKLRYAYMSELFIRLDEANYKMMIMSLESCIQQETELQNRKPKDWSATVRFENGEIKLYFMALSYYQ